MRDHIARPHARRSARTRAWRSFCVACRGLYHLLWVLVLVPVAVPGILLNAPASLLINWGARREMRRAVARSRVKLAGRDVVTSFKVVKALVVVPVLYSAYAALVAGAYCGGFLGLAQARVTWAASLAAPLRWGLAFAVVFALLLAYVKDIQDTAVVV